MAVYYWTTHKSKQTLEMPTIMISTQTCSWSLKCLKKSQILKSKHDKMFIPVILMWCDVRPFGFALCCVTTYKKLENDYYIFSTNLKMMFLIEFEWQVQFRASKIKRNSVASFAEPNVWLFTRKHLKQWNLHEKWEI